MSVARRKKDAAGGEEDARVSSFPDEVLEHVLVFLKSHKDRSAVSLVCKDWYAAERWSRTHVFIGNCYSVSPQILVRRFPNIRSITLKGKPRFSDFNLVPPHWGADIHSWLVVLAKAYPFLEELRLKRMTVTDESLDFLATSFPNFRALSLVSCDGFSTDGLASIATHCLDRCDALALYGSTIEQEPQHKLNKWPLSFFPIDLKWSPDPFTSWFLGVAEYFMFTETTSEASWKMQLCLIAIGAQFADDDSLRLQNLLVDNHLNFCFSFRNPSYSHTLFKLFARNLTEMDIQENDILDLGGHWLSCFPESYSSLEILNFASLNSEVSFDALERLVSRCKSLKVLKVNKCVSPEQLQRLLIKVPNLVDLGTGSLLQELTIRQFAEVKSALGNCKKLHTLSGLWEVSSLYIPALSLACANLTFLNLSYAVLQNTELAQLLAGCPQLRRLWVLDTVEDKGLEAVASACPGLEELRVFPAAPYEPDLSGVTESGFVAVSRGCPNLRYVLYFCRRMTNAAVETVAKNCPNFTHFRLCIMNPCEPDYLTNDPMDEGFGAVVKHCSKIQRLAVSGLLTDRSFEYIGLYAKNLETLSVAFAGSSDRGMQYVLQGCPKLRKLEIRDCPFGNAALLSGLERYEQMRSLWMSACRVTMSACRILAREMPRLNVEVIKDPEGDEAHADKVYVYRSVAGPRTDAPPFVLTL